MNAMAPWFAYTMKRKLQPDSNVLRVHFLHIMKRKPHFHDGTVLVMVDTSNNSSVELPLAVSSHQMSDWLRFGKHLEHNHHKQRTVKYVFACELCKCNRYTSEHFVSLCFCWQVYRNGGYQGPGEGKRLLNPVPRDQRLYILHPLQRMQCNFRRKHLRNTPTHFLGRAE